MSSSWRRRGRPGRPDHRPLLLRGLQHALSRRYKQPAWPASATSAASTEFKRRADDNEEAVRTRMAEYRAKTAPILPHYEAQGIVRRVDGMARSRRSARRSTGSSTAAD
jgi:adenylate kinase family enzyme